MSAKGAKGGAARRRVYNRVRVLRPGRGLSRRELAEELGVGYRTLGYIERQDYNPSLPMAWRVDCVFDLPADAVWSEEPLEPLSELAYGGRC